MNSQNNIDFFLFSPSLLGETGRGGTAGPDRPNELKIMYEMLKHAVRTIAGVCDGARAQDGVGFNGTDTRFGRWLANQEEWKLKWAIKAHKILLKYSETQLARAGINYHAIPDPRDEGDEWAENRPVCTIEDLEGVDWTEPKTVSCKDGKKRTVEDAPIPDGFWDLWKAKKPFIKATGISVSSYGGAWKLVRWTELEPEPEIPTVDDTELDEILAGCNWNPLYDYQVPHAQKMLKALKKFGYGLDGSSTGTGKTYTECVVVREAKLRPLVVCPKPVIHGWLKTLNALGMEFLGIANYELAREGKMRVQVGKYTRGRNKGQPKFEVVDCPYIKVTLNPKEGRYEPKNIITFDLPEDGVLIFDEAHRCKNRDTNNAQMMKACVEAKCNRLLLTATLASSPLKLDAPGYALGLHESKWDFFRWAGEHGARKTDWGWQFDYDIREMKKIHAEIYGAGKGSRMDVEELVSKGLFPESKVIAEAYEMDRNADLIQKAYAEMFEEIDKLEAEEEKMTSLLAIRQKARQKVEMLKVPLLLNLALDQIDEGNSVVIFVNYTNSLLQIVSKLKDVLKMPIPTIYGGNNGTTNEANRQRFQLNEAPVIVCNVAAAREGIDLHDERHERPRVAYITPDDNAQNIRQCIGRVWRAGGTPSVQYIVFAANTIEEEVCNNVAIKIINLNVLNDGDLEIRNPF